MPLTRITLGDITDILPDAANKTEKMCETTAEQMFASRRRIRIKLPDKTHNLPFAFTGRVPTPQEFLERVDSYLTSQKQYLTNITSFRTASFCTTAHITGTLYQEKEQPKEQQTPTYLAL